MIEPPDPKKIPNAPSDPEPNDLPIGPPEASPELSGVGSTKPCIRVSPGYNHVSTEVTESRLAATGLYFISGGALVRVIDRENQGVSVEQVHEQTLKSVLSAMFDWERKGPNDAWIRCDPAHGVIQALLYGQDRYHLQTLNGLARQPYFAADGKLNCHPGFDPGTGIYGAFDEALFRLEEPTRKLAEHSLERMKALLCEFEFESDADQSAALGAMLTAVVRPSLATAPAFNITATGSGSGKSCLADVITPYAGPEDPYRVSFPERHDEAGKLVVTVLREKPTVVLFDDMQGNWKSLGPLNRALTSSTTTERLLGSNRTATVSTRVLFLGTGNNVEPERDMRRRVVTIRLAPRSETPALRSFKSDPVGYMREHRAEMVVCALNIVRAFQAAGAPLKDVPPIGTYEEWSRYCRHPLIWLGQPDPARSLLDQVSHDPDREVLAEFLETWLQKIGSHSVTVRQIVAKAEERTVLMEALEDLPVFDGRHVNRGRLGWFISKNRGRRVNAEGLRIERGDLSERNSWRVVKD